MSSIIKPPATYSEWLHCFDHVKLHGLGREYAEVLSKGTLKADEETVALLCEKLAALLNAVLNSSIRAFTRQLNMLSEKDDPEQIACLLKRLKDELKKCMFFTALAFIPRRIRLELCDTIKNELDRFRNDLAAHFKKEIPENGRGDGAYLACQIRRVNFGSLFTGSDWRSDG